MSDLYTLTKEQELLAWTEGMRRQQWARAQRCSLSPNYIERYATITNLALSHAYEVGSELTVATLINKRWTGQEPNLTGLNVDDRIYCRHSKMDVKPNSNPKQPHLAIRKDYKDGCIAALTTGWWPHFYLLGWFPVAAAKTEEFIDTQIIVGQFVVPRNRLFDWRLLRR